MTVHSFHGLARLLQCKIFQKRSYSIPDVRPSSYHLQPVPTVSDHIAIAWDESRVAARALGYALSLLPEGGRVSVLTVRDEKPLSGPDIAALLATSLGRRGIEARSLLIDRGDRTIAEALQDTALAEGAQVLAMGGFGHSRMRDFVLGGATCGVLADARLPVLLVH